MRYHLGGPAEYERFVLSWAMKDLGEIDEYLLE
jgi:hypothetical protein